MDRQAVMDALYACRTAQEAQAALAVADAWADDHPDDFDVAMVMESAVMTLEAWDVMSQADRDAEMADLARARESDDHF